jgi:hypothetical protein
MAVYAGKDAVYTRKTSAYTGKDAIYTRKDAIHTCKGAICTRKDSIHTCKDSIYTCKDAIHTCKDAIYTCKGPIYTCKMAVYTGHILASAGKTAKMLNKMEVFPIQQPKTGANMRPRPTDLISAGPPRTFTTWQRVDAG